MSKLKKNIFLILTLLPAFALLGQNTQCLIALQNAQRLYNQGLIEDIESILRPCLENGFTRNQRNEALKLIIQASLLDGNQQQAENTMNEFLKKNPEYEIMPNDPIEFVYLFESYRTQSVFSIGVKFGPNYSDPQGLQGFTSADATTTRLSDQPGVGYQVGVSAAKYITRHFFLEIGSFYHQNRYTFIEERQFFYLPTEKAKTTILFHESLTRIDFPLSLGFEFNGRRVLLFLTAGGNYSHILGALGAPEAESTVGESFQSGREIDLDRYRASHLLMVHGGFGMKIRVPRGFVVGELKYTGGFDNLASGRRFDLGELMSGYYHIDNDFTLHTISLSAGYYFSFYQSRKRP